MSWFQFHGMVAGANIISWWELLVKPGIKQILIERGKEMTHLKNGRLNLLLLRKSYLTRKHQQGNLNYIAQKYFKRNKQGQKPDSRA